MSHQRAARALLALPALFVLLSCADGEPPTAPVSDLRASETLSVGQARLISCPAGDVQAVTGNIGVAGGRLGIGGHELLVPKGAISSPQRFEIAVRSSPYLVVAFRAVGHEHFEFAVPVQLTLSYGRCEADAEAAGALNVYYVDGETLSILEDVGGTVNADANTVTAVADHLSDYAVGSPQ